MTNIYRDVKFDSGFIRIFKEDIKSSDLVWHRDRKDRLIEVLNGDGWWLQYDNMNPFPLKLYQYYVIPKYTYHRLIKGEDILILKILEQ